MLCGFCEYYCMQKVSDWQKKDMVNHQPNTDGKRKDIQYETKRMRCGISTELSWFTTTKQTGKPDPETITQLKSRGFRWTPSQRAWQRKLTVIGTT
jgi:hypothetical protein